MAITDTYVTLKTKDKDELFVELFKLKEEKAELDKKIKAIEKEYKPSLEGLNRDLFYELSNGIRFSIKASQRKGNIDTVRLENDGVDVDSYRKKSTTIHTLRIDK